MVEIPDLARRVLGAQAELAAAYAHLLVTTGIEHGLIGPREAPRIWERHVVNCALAAPAFEVGASVADLGSGAGLPGIVLAIARPDLRVHLVEPLHRRIVWLRPTVEQLGLVNVEVHEGRAEAYAGRLRVRHTTARAVARLDVLTRWSAPLVEAGGSLIALKGAAAARELDADWPAMRRAGATAAHVRIYRDGHGEGIDHDGDLGDEPTRVVVVEFAGSASTESNRHSGVHQANGPGRQRGGRHGTASSVGSAPRDSGAGRA